MIPRAASQTLDMRNEGLQWSCRETFNISKNLLGIVTGKLYN